MKKTRFNVHQSAYSIEGKLRGRQGKIQYAMNVPSLCNYSRQQLSKDNWRYEITGKSEGSDHIRAKLI